MAVPPVVRTPTPQAGVFAFTFLTYSGTGVLVSGIIAGLLMGFSPVALVKNWFKTIYAVRFALITITLMLSLATLTGTSGIQGTLGLAFAAHRRALSLLQRGAGLAGRGGDRARTPPPMCCSAASRWWRPIMPASIRC